MDKITVWITTDDYDMLTSYSMVEKEGYTKIQAEAEPIDYTNWGVRQNILVHYPDDLPTPIAAIDVLRKQNAKLTLQLTEASEKIQQGNILAAKMMLEISELKKKTGGQ